MLNDDLDSIVQKIKKAKTDSHPLPNTIKEAEERPEALNLLTIFAALEGNTKEKVLEKYAGKEFAFFKKDLSDLSVEKLSPISKEIRKLMNDEAYLDGIMKLGKEKALSIAEPVLRKVNDIVGFQSH